MVRNSSSKTRKKFNRRIKGIQKEIHKFYLPHNNLFIATLLSIIFFLLVEVAIRIYNLYKDVPLIDVPSHLVGGIALGFIASWALSLTDIKSKKIYVVVFAFIGALVWEILETLQELVFYNPPYLQDIFWWDGFWDVIVTTLGGIIALSIISYLRNKKFIL